MRNDESQNKAEATSGKRVAIIGGGAAGFFCGIRLKELCNNVDVHIFEQQKDVLRKVAISGGGRCNCTNTFAEIKDLSMAYPRGATLLKRLFKQFSPQDAFEWFESHGVPLIVQPDECIFPKAQDSKAIIDCFMREARRHKINIHTGRKIERPTELLSEYTDVVVTTGGQQRQTLSLPTELTACVPSLFTLNINDPALHSLMGIVTEETIVSIPGTKLKATGALLLTHWGMSGPAILKLSSYAARYLAEHNYKTQLSVNWTGETNTESIRHKVEALMQNSSTTKLIDNIRPYNLNARLWNYLLQKLQLSGKPIGNIGSKGINKLAETLSNDRYTIAGRSHYKDEFVTCGGISLDNIDKHTLESRTTPHLYFAGEVLDIDGITGGFNFQATWTTADAVARGISK